VRSLFALLLAEYKSGAAVFLPTKEYGYRGGELLVTMASGDDTRLARFVTNLYYGAKQTDPTPAQLQDGVNQLAAAGAQGYSQLLAAASQLARGLFTGTNYEAANRTDQQYVADLYYTYLQRAPDDGGLGYWTGQAAGNRANVCNGFEASAEFQTLVSTLYGTATSDNQRTDQLVNNFYLAANGTSATSTQLQQQRDALNAAAAVGLSQVQAQVESMGRSLFAAQVSDYSISDQQFVTNLYEAFLQRGPDAGGLGFWTSIAAGGSANRQNVLNAFAPCGPARELAGTLYREAFWMVSDQLGTPRMIADKSGSLASVKRHDYLPFGEELFGGAPSQPGLGGRTTTQGYAADSTRQKFTLKERDSETGLDYSKHRYYASALGRFTTVDPALGSSSVSYPASWNKYAYVGNNPLRYIDPTGLIWLEAKDGSGYQWVKDDAYKKDDYKDKWNEVATGTVIFLGGVGGDYSKYKNLLGSNVVLDEGGALSPALVLGTVTISARQEDECVTDMLTAMIGGSAAPNGQVVNHSGTSYHKADDTLHSIGFHQYYGDPHPDHWGGQDYQGQIDGRWYHVTLGYPDRFTLNCGPGEGCSQSYDTDQPWTFMQNHSHNLMPQFHFVEWPFEWIDTSQFIQSNDERYHTNGSGERVPGAHVGP
jgi:RHS repeat-associated protein